MTDWLHRFVRLGDHEDRRASNYHLCGSSIHRRRSMPARTQETCYRLTPCLGPLPGCATAWSGAGRNGDGKHAVACIAEDAMAGKPGGRGGAATRRVCVNLGVFEERIFRQAGRSHAPGRRLIHDRELCQRAENFRLPFGEDRVHQSRIPHHLSASRYQ
jgi:hypothetical protein